LDLGGDLADAAETLLKVRTLLAFDRRAACYPIHRTERCAVRRAPDDLLDDLAIHGSLLGR
jgi:hypothetical protein